MLKIYPKSPPVDYSLESSEEWNNIGVAKENSKTSFIYAQSSYETTTSKIDASSFSNEVWDEIGIIANKKTNINNGRLLYINAKVVSPKRKIIKLTADVDSNLFMISYDSSDVDENGKKVNIEDSNRSALNSIIPTLPFSDNLKKEISNSYEQGSNKVITKAALDGLSFLTEDNILVIPTTNTINIENKQTTEHSERLTSEHYNLKSSEIEKDAKKEYSTNGSFKNFFSNFPCPSTLTPSNCFFKIPISFNISGVISVPFSNLFKSLKLIVAYSVLNIAFEKPRFPILL